MRLIAFFIFGSTLVYGGDLIKCFRHFIRGNFAAARVAWMDPVPTDRPALEQEMNQLISKDPELHKPANEIRYYELAREYSQWIPDYNSVETLVAEGILRVENGKMVSNYILSHTNLGALTWESTGSTYKIVLNRGTSYFRGTTHPAFGSYSALDFIKTSEAKEIYKNSNLTVVLAIHQDEARRHGINVNRPEIVIDSSQLRQMTDVRIFKTSVHLGDFYDYLRGKRKP